MSVTKEIINIGNALEQTVVVMYGTVAVYLEFQWNSKYNYWMLNVKKGDTYIAYAIPLKTYFADLFYEKYGLGKLLLLDTLYGQTSDPILKSDLGGRIKLMRIY